MADSFNAVDIANLDQMGAAAKELARTVAAQYKIYRDAGMSKQLAGELAYAYHRSCVEPDVVVQFETSDEED